MHLILCLIVKNPEDHAKSIWIVMDNQPRKTDYGFHVGEYKTDIDAAVHRECGLCHNKHTVPAEVGYHPRSGLFVSTPDLGQSKQIAPPAMSVVNYRLVRDLLEGDIRQVDKLHPRSKQTNRARQCLFLM